ncbi:MAG: Fe-S cluster assembly sulfur transfer protein SufU [Blastocatellia bacterium]
MSDISELYQQVILDHNRKPRNFRVLDKATRTQEGYNPLCGDQLTLYLEMDGEVIRDISFQGQGCAISKASASMMTAAIKDKTKEEAERLFTEFHRMVKGELDPKAEPHHLGRLTILAGVSEYPARVKCASLSWHTLHAALEGQDDPVSTE